MSDPNGKIAVVTGANSGMGYATVEALSDMGATVLMLCRSKERGMAAIASLTAQKERNLELILCDLGDYSSIRNAAEYVKANYPRVDILVNNAGFISLDRQETKEDCFPAHPVSDINEGYDLKQAQYLLGIQVSAMKGNKQMAWTVKRIQESDFGCEERTDKERSQVIVTLENENGLTRQLTVDDDWLYTMEIDEGSVWPENGIPEALKIRI